MVDPRGVLRAIWKDDSGQDLVEYVLILVLISLAVAGAMVVWQESLSSVFNNTAEVANSAEQPDL